MDMGDATNVDAVSATATVPEVDEAARQKASMADMCHDKSSMASDHKQEVKTGAPFKTNQKKVGKD
eukprot:9190653-Karenia_brevis.AAC.1